MLTVHSDEHYMQMALVEAAKAFDSNEIPVGAVVVAENRIIAKAHNQVEQLQDVTAHAEMIALTAAQNFLGSKYLNDCKLLVTLEPCTMCAGALYWSQIGEIVIGARDEKRGFSRLDQQVLHPKTSVTFGIKELECEAIMKDFFKKMRGNIL